MDINNTLVSDAASALKKIDIQKTQEPLTTSQNFFMSSHLLKIVIGVNPIIVAALQQQAIELFKLRTLEGFAKGCVPNEYIEENFKHEIFEKIKQYLLHNIVLQNLMSTISLDKLLIANYPRLSKIDLHDSAIQYHFDLSVADAIELKEWKNFSFKSPKRKKYKDLDKQVINYVEQECAEAKKHTAHCVEDYDWIFFEALLVDKQNVPVHPFLKNTYWIKLKNNDVLDPLHALFLGKKVNDTFTADCLEIDAPVNDYENYRFNYLIHIKAIVKGRYLSLEHLKNTFKLKNKTDIHNKLMEVFSYRNDVSQRKAIIEELFHLMLSKHRFEIPKHLVLRRQEDLLTMLANQPDYQVYKAQKNFTSYIELLAEKQLKEEIFIDQVCYQENITLEIVDMQNYLHLFNNKRLREFVYFKPISDHIDEPNVPISNTFLATCMLREKTLNHIIHTLSH